MTKPELALNNQKDAYIHFTVNDVQVPIPYFKSKTRFNFWETAGKGTPEMIREELRKKADLVDVDLSTLAQADLYAFMKQQSIGIECSGFVYHLLDAYLQEAINQSIATHLIRYPGIIGLAEKKILSWRRYRRINVKTLTSPLNSIEITTLSDLRIGDMIRVSGQKPGDHILVVTDLKYDSNSQLTEIMYAHSSAKDTRRQGPHEEMITITDKNSSLDMQQWHEIMKDGTIMDEFKPKLGDKIWRLKSIDAYLKQL